MTSKLVNNKTSTNLNSGIIDIEGYQLTELQGYIEVFLDFSRNDITSAVKELSKIKNESNRIHLQKLVYTNLVNRFDYLIDQVLVWLSSKNSTLRSVIFNTLEKEPLTKKETYELLFMSLQDKNFVMNKIEEMAQSYFLRVGHSVKLKKILSVVMEEKDLIRPRVAKNGQIYTKKLDGKRQTQSILDYADWLYCRRNSITHGDGRNYESSDYERLKKRSIISSEKFNIALASIRTANTFYDQLLTEFKSKVLEGNVLSQNERI